MKASFKLPFLHLIHFYNFSSSLLKSESNIIFLEKQYSKTDVLHS